MAVSVSLEGSHSDMLRERDGEEHMGERTKWEGPLERPAGAGSGHAGRIRRGRSGNGTPGVPHVEETETGPVSPGTVHSDKDWCEAFAGTVEAEIVPRLLALTGEKSPRRVPVPADLVSAVADAAVNAEAGIVESHVLSHVVNGASLADALLDIIGPAARQLGTAWETDDRDFMEVTIGLGTLQQVLSSLSDERMHPAMPNRRILLGPTPGEGHTLGLAIIDHLFRAARWDVVFDPYADRRGLMEAVHTEWFAVAGLTLSADGFVDEARETVAALREASMNPRLRILMGGPAFERREGLGKRIGVDGVVTDGRAAVEIADRWVANSAEEPRQ